MTAEDEVREASRQFYAALNSLFNGDSGPMAAVWDHGPTVTSLRPFGGREVGWQAVRDAFAMIAARATGGDNTIHDQIIEVGGDMAYEVGVERGHLELAGQRVPVEYRVTNVYRRRDDGWKMVHHHTDTSPALIETLRGLTS
ncbi:MAG: nuclear transport factor 2 family protein [Pseudomonadota bacterium]